MNAVRRAFSLLFALAPLLAAGGCGTEGPAGVHLDIALDDSTGWLPADAFDHITVTATDAAGDLTAVACFSTSTVTGFAAFVPTNVIAGDDPCADEPNLAWSTPPTVKDWSFASGSDAGGATPRRVNFAFPEGIAVHVTAVAALGGGAAIGNASAALTSVVGYASASMNLTRTAPTVNPACAPTTGTVSYGSVVGAGMATAVDCDASPVACVTSASRGSTGAEHTAAMTCDSDQSVTIDNLAGLAVCSDADDASLVYRSGPVSEMGCAALALQIRFYGCANAAGGGAECVKTSKCTLPQLYVGATDATKVVGRSASTPTTVNITDCVVPTAFAVPVTVALKGGLTSFAYELSETATTADECHVEIDSITPFKLTGTTAVGCN